MTTYQNSTDRHLATLLLQGDQRAYTEIFERYHKLLIKHAFQLLQEKEAAGDLVQDVFLTLWQKRETISVTNSLSSYLYTATRNKVFNLLSHQKVASRYAESIANFMEEGHSMTDVTLREKELARIIEKEIDALPTKMREVFLLRSQEELSYQQIGEQLNITKQTAKLQMHNALKILKIKIKSYLHVLWLL
ncbi:RNA polymerase sigma factor [Sphingobacterium sp. HJSM2_6]|uniref:RNA polymerase sigma factor n=1 Tax=Sphingobacterium sp. HJSM2_6 TaxID=3366264 RepID=UPI003BBCA718